MSEFKLHDLNTAPEASRPLLEDSLQAFGMIPNLHAVMAESPALLKGYKKLHELFTQTSFTAAEQTVVWQAINVEHGCHYCVPAHTAIAKTMQVSDAVIDALREETALPDARLEALRRFTLRVVRQRGQIAAADLQAFIDAGYSRQHVGEVLLGVAQKVMSNYLNAIAETPVDQPFQKFVWRRSAA
ncbi:MAG: carboxymuconolactone decarboxylase family protein [Pseudomonadales bacterium]